MTQNYVFYETEIDQIILIVGNKNFYKSWNLGEERNGWLLLSKWRD